MLKKTHIPVISVLCLFFLCVPAQLPAAEIPENEKCVANELYSPFALDYTADGLLLGASAGTAITGLVLNKRSKQPEWYERTYNKKDIPALDKIWYNKYSSVLDNTGTVVCAVNLLVLPITTFTVETAIKNLPARELATIGVMYAESWLFAYGIRNIIKTSVHRIRPYMYTEKIDESELKSHDFEFSFPSGHTTDAFLGASFVSYVFSTYYPQSQYKWPIIAGSYAIAVGTGALRIASGNHFLTDVLGGAALGTALGFGIPFIHQKLAQSKHGRNGISLLPNGVNACFYF